MMHAVLDALHHRGWRSPCEWASQRTDLRGNAANMTSSAWVLASNICPAICMGQELQLQLWHDLHGAHVGCMARLWCQHCYENALHDWMLDMPSDPSWLSSFILKLSIWVKRTGQVPFLGAVEIKRLGVHEWVQDPCMHADALRKRFTHNSCKHVYTTCNGWTSEQCQHKQLYTSCGWTCRVSVHDVTCFGRSCMNCGSAAAAAAAAAQRSWLPTPIYNSEWRRRKGKWTDPQQSLEPCTCTVYKRLFTVYNLFITMS